MAVKCILTGQTPSVLDGVTENIQTQINAKAADSAVVHLAGDETISGAKTFTGKVVMNSSDNVGIGTTAPSEKLEVTGNIKATKFKGDGSELTNIPYPVTKVAGKTGAVTLAKGDVGLGNVDNTSDVNKPISNATQAVLNGKQAKITTSGILKGDGAGNVSGATPGTDYVASPEIFWATYNVTTFPEIKAAYDAGKVILLKIPVNVVETTTTEASQVAPLENYFYENSEQHGEYGSAQFSLQGLSNVRGYPYQKLSDNYLYMVSYSNNTTNWENNYSISAPVSTSCEKILLAADWDAAAKTQTLSNMELIDAFTNGSLRIAQSATDEQFTAWGAAQPRVTAQAYGSITVKIAGTVPTIDIPVEVLIV